MKKDIYVKKKFGYELTEEDIYATYKEYEYYLMEQGLYSTHKDYGYKLTEEGTQVKREKESRTEIEL